MSVRIHELARKIGMENKELLTILQDRGYSVKSVSSTIDNISAESLESELSSDGEPAAQAGSNDAPADSTGDEAARKEEAAKKPKLPPGVFVRSKDDIERERKAVEAKEAEAREEERQKRELEREEMIRKKEEEREERRRHTVVQAPPPAPGPAGRPPMANRPGSVPPPPRAGGPRQAPQAAPRAGAQRPQVNVPPSVVRQPENRDAGRPAIPPVRPPAQKAPLRAAPPSASPQPAARTHQPPAKKAPPSASPSQPRQSGPPPAGSPGAPRPPAPAAGRPPAAGGPPRPPSQPGKPPAPVPMGKTPDEGEPPAETGDAAAEAGDAPKLRKIQAKPPIVVRDFANLIDTKPFKLISELMEMNIFASMNQVVDEDVAVELARRHGFELDVKHRGEATHVTKESLKEKPVVEEDDKNLSERPPVVCVLGHVDHGKTTLLDTIRKANVVAGEAGGITQHIGAYQIEHNDKKLTFIDTPGHAAFSNMRRRGAGVTDIAILVVAADDGFMPQTDEALSHAKGAGVPVVVAINKMDTKGANPDRVKQQMQERGMAPEDWGGETICVPISAIKSEGIDELLEMILLQTEIMELKANERVPAEGVILETQKEQGRGSTASVIVKRGTLSVGDALLCGPFYCRVRGMVASDGSQVKKATPSTPVVVMGWNGTPNSGMEFKSVKNERIAKKEAEQNAFELKQAQAKSDQEQNTPTGDKDDALAMLFSAIEQTQKKVFRVVVKADVYGTAEALATALESIESDKIELEVIEIGVGAVSQNDVKLASASEAAIVAFSIGLENGVTALAKHHNVHLFRNEIIYMLIDEVREAMADELPPELRENKMGAAEVRAVFPVSRGAVAGCLVTEGIVKRDLRARVVRKGEILAEGRVTTLRRFKDDVTEVRSGFECGIRISDFDGYEEGDTIEIIEIQKIRAKL